MTPFRRIADLPDTLRGGAVALGNFDGVHGGHRAVIAEACAQARALRAPAAVLTFEPHPRRLFRPDDPPFRLTPAPQKLRLIAAQGVDGVVELPFDADFSRRTAEGFVRDFLVAGLGVRHVVVGHDFRFGHGRAGDGALLTRMGAELGFGATAVGPVVDAGGDAVSSTRIRTLLQEGRPDEAAALMGRPFTVEGPVEHGDKRGRTIGVPTANVPLGDHLRPRFGVYAVRVMVPEGEGAGTHAGVANLGRRPTVGGTVERLEAHLFDVDTDLYGRDIRVELHRFLRPEMKFDSFDALKTQIAADMQAARAALRMEPFLRFLAGPDDGGDPPREGDELPPSKA